MHPCRCTADENLKFHVQYEFDERLRYEGFPDFDYPPGVRRIAEFIRAMLPTAAVFLNSVRQLASAREDRPECLINANLRGRWDGVPYDLLHMRYQPSIGPEGLLTQVSMDLGSRIEYKICESDITALAKRLAKEV